MSKIYEYDSDFGKITINVDNDNNDLYRDSESNNTTKAKRKFDEAISVVKSTALSMGKLMKEIEPSEATVEFNIKASGEAGIFSICKVSGEADFKISVTWKN
jgi:hypothetical protein